MQSRRSPKGKRRVPNASAGRRSHKIDIPQALAEAGPHALWAEGGPGRMLSKLAAEADGGNVLLTSDELAALIELFRDERLPESLRNAVAAQLQGKRLRRDGRPERRKASLERVEEIMLPGVYDEALEEAKIERARLRKQGRKQGRYDDPERLPTVSAIASDLVRKWLPTLGDRSDKSIANLVSKIKRQLADADEDAGGR